ncbi:LysE family translocator [Halobacillus salinarum]|uniref:LysE family translocator n=1 Tax=Halobacillus salinarum TaxID=2932257 RepID=A0ABY4EI32_9BACI|nr:LysE family transporter [Halobacillus salinarum]UOQ43723.1 LysE family translocator [Halobacillus salinarum]
MFQLLFSGLVIGFVSSPTCPSNGEEIKHGTKYGLTSSLVVGLGAVTGDAIVLSAILLWLMPFISTESILVTYLWLFGSIVLFYVAWGIFKEISTVQGVKEKRMSEIMNPARHYLRAFWIGTVITTFNPFTVMWWMGLLIPIVNDEDNISLVYPVSILAGALLWFVLLAVLLHLGERWLNKKKRQIILLISGLAVLGYSVYFFIQFVNQLL